jgi:hypothetical protein
MNELFYLRDDLYVIVKFIIGLGTLCFLLGLCHCLMLK